MSKYSWIKFDMWKIVVVLVIAVTAVMLNAQIRKREIAGAKLDIAIAVLSQAPSEGTNALRKWAIEVLQAPQADNDLGEAAAAELRKQALPVRGD